MKMGILGLPNVGKSTLFNAITMAGAECANYPFCTIEPNVGVVAVPDERLAVLAQMYNTGQVVPATLEFVDIAGLVRGASRGEGLGNKFLAHIREVDALLHIVRCYDDPNIIHVDEVVDPLRDIETINTELIFADLDALERRKTRVQSAAKGGAKGAVAELELLARLVAHLESGQCVSTMTLDEAERALVEQMFLLTSKPVIYCCNIAERDIGAPANAHVRAVEQFAASTGTQVLSICARAEEEIAALPAEEQPLFLAELGLGESGLAQIVRVGYQTLGLISFLTAGPKEVRAWTITRGTRAPQAAGRIHTDFERGFIRAEVVSCDELVAAGSLSAARERGRVRSEGKDYVVADGDVVLFRFNV